MCAIDLRTQASYQFMDAGFVGLIFSCFNTDTNLVSGLHVVFNPNVISYSTYCLPYYSTYVSLES